MPTPILVTLTAEEFEMAQTEGAARWKSVTDRNAKGTGLPSQSRYHTIGVLGEVAFAKWSGLPWLAPKGANYIRECSDVGTMEVKTRYLGSGPDIYARFNEVDKYSPDQLYVLAWSDAKRKVYLVGYTSLGTIVDYGTYDPRWEAYILPWQNCCDLKELFHGIRT